MRTVAFVILFSLISNVGWAAGLPSDQPTSRLTRCIRYLTANGKRGVHRVRWGREKYRTEHNLREIKRLIAATATGKFPSTIHADYLRYQPYLAQFERRINARLNGPGAIVVFNTVHTYLYNYENFPTPDHYEPGVILVIRQSDQMVQVGYRTEMLDELYRIRGSRLQIGMAIRNVEALEEAERSDEAAVSAVAKSLR